MDLSHLDKKYFIDAHVYNCTFCKRNNVPYTILEHFEFDWTENKKCYGYLVKCESAGCGKVSLHWSWKELIAFIITDKINNRGYYSNSFSESFLLDKEFFFSRPSSFFTLDNRVPVEIRQLIFEAEESRQANFLVGASACLRRAIYELLEHEKSIILNSKTNRPNYQSSIKELKKKFTSTVAPELFDGLANIQEMSSDPLHEGSWREWDSPKIRFLIELLKTIFDEMYIIPDERKKRLSILDQLKNTFEGDKNIKNKVK